MTYFFLLFFLIILVMGFFYFYRLEKNIFNSPCLFIISILAVILSNIFVGGNNNYNVPYLKIIYYKDILLYYGLGVSGFALAWFFLNSLTPIRYGQLISLKQKPDVLEKFDIYLIAGFALMLIYAVVKIGQLPILSMFMNKMDINQFDESSKKLFIGHLALLNGLGTIICFRCSYLLFEKDKKYLKMIVFIAMALLACFWGGKRQLFLFLTFAVLAWENAGERLTLKRFFFYIGSLLLVVGVFVAVNKVRYPEKVNHTSSIIWGYYGWPFLNTQAILQHCKFESCSYAKYFTLSEILPSRIAGKDTLAMAASHLHEPTSPSGYFLYWFLDFGFMGVFIGGLLLGSIGFLFRKIRDRNSMTYYGDIIVMYCSVMTFMYSHLITTVYFLIPWVILMIFQYLAHLKEDFASSKA